MRNEKNGSLGEKEIFDIIKEYLLNFDVLNSTGQEARDLIAWLQLEIKANEKRRFRDL